MDQSLIEETIAQADDLYRNARLREALDLYERVELSDQSRAWVYNRIGAIQAQLGEEAKAEDALKKAIELDPTLPQAHSNLGNIFYARGDFEAALGKYQHAATLSPETPVFQENLHAAYKKLGRLGDAVTALKAAHRLDRQQTKVETRARFDSMKQRAKGRFGCMGTVLFLALMITMVFTVL
jgi:Flp pilus assembly protein TadD